MVGDPGEDARHGNALALRFLGWLLLLGAVLLLLPLIIVLCFPIAAGALVVPGTGGRHSVSDAIVPVLMGTSGLFAAVGLLSLVVGRRPPSHRFTLASSARRRGLRPAAVLLGGLALLVVALLRR